MLNFGASSLKPKKKTRHTLLAHFFAGSFWGPSLKTPSDRLTIKNPSRYLEVIDALQKIPETKKSPRKIPVFFGKYHQKLFVFLRNVVADWKNHGIFCR